MDNKMLDFIISFSSMEETTRNNILLELIESQKQEPTTDEEES